MPIKIIIEKELEEWWGAEDLRDDFADKDDFHNALIEVVRDDIDALLDGATWRVEE